MTDRQFEIVLYGASGFTGKLVAEYLASDHQDLAGPSPGAMRRNWSKCGVS